MIILDKIKTLIKPIENNLAVIDYQSNFEEAMYLLNQVPINSMYKGIGLVLKNKKLFGTFFDGDIRRASGKNITINQNLHAVINKEPITINIDMVSEKQISTLKRKLINRNIKIILVINNNSELIGFIDQDDFKSNKEFQQIGVVGLGFVGLTLAVHIASKGYTTQCIDTNKKLINSLKKNKIPFYEDGLSNKLSEFLRIKRLSLSNQIATVKECDIIFVCVGTPINEDNNPNVEIISNCIRDLSLQIKQDAVICVRSTVPIGTGENVLIPIISENLKISQSDVRYVMAPERTIEGKAMIELETLPQIFACNNNKFLDFIENHFKNIFPEITQLDTIKEGEIGKLICNAYRDLSFAFSNECASYCETFNINAHKLIEKISKDYPRGKIAYPSPGVGGYCLTKDPFIYSNSFGKKENLSALSRKINIKASFSPDRALDNFLKSFNVNVKNIAVVGLAFKGDPTTNDIRGSTALEFVRRIEREYNIIIYDFGMNETEIKKLNILVGENGVEISCDIDCVFILNNHRKNKFLKINDWLNTSKKKLIFDGWNQYSYLNGFSQNLLYTTMGKLK